MHATGERPEPSLSLSVSMSVSMCVDSTVVSVVWLRATVGACRVTHLPLSGLAVSRA